MLKSLKIPDWQLTQTQKIFFSLILSVAVITAGVLYQYSYNARKIRYTEIITGYYRQYFHREPDAIGLRHWVTWALNKWSIKKVERIGFKEVAEKEAAGGAHS